jgi:hypothetical protein
MKKYYLLFALLSTFLFSNAQGPTLDSVVTATPIVCYGADATVTAHMAQTIPGTPVKLLNYKYAGAIGSSLFSFGSSGVTTGANQPFTDLPAFNYRMFMVDSIAFYTAFPPGPNSPLQPELQNPTHPSIFDYKDYTVSQPTAILVTETISNISCNAGSDGEVTLNSSGGTGALVENWGTTNPTQLSVGTYSYTVTDASSCTYNGSVTITEPTTLISSGFISQGIIGNGNSNGQITGSVSGGTAPYQYSINNGVFQSNPVFSNLGFGTYQITYKDTNDCTVTEQILLTQPAPVSGNISI